MSIIEKEGVRNPNNNKDSAAVPLRKLDLSGKCTSSMTKDELEKLRRTLLGL